LVVKNGSNADRRTSFVMPQPVSRTSIDTYGPCERPSCADGDSGSTASDPTEIESVPPAIIASLALTMRFSIT
jgi:hypothetical protein